MIEGNQKSKIAEREEEILKFWEDNKIFEKSLEQTKNNKPFVFHDGPPFATGTPHYGHLVASVMKDVIPRYQTMRGRFVERRWGWDTHGLPIENIVEKELGIKSKKEIEEIGIGKFNNLCRDKIFTYVDVWNKFFPRFGRWVNMDSPYRTMDSTYMESEWWAFKKLFDKDLIYKDYRSLHICPRCETTLAQAEVAEGYKDVKDIAVTVKFELVDEPGTYLIAWTTTPWTLPGNVALAVGADIEYVKVRISMGAQIQKAGTGTYKVNDTEFVYIAKNILKTFEEVRPGVFWNPKWQIELIVDKSLFGKDLVGRSYKPIFDDYYNDKKLPNHANGWKVYVADFVTTESGTGIVHIAPAFGEDDMELGKKEKLPFIQHVGMNGAVKPEVKGFAGRQVKPKSDLSAQAGNDKERLGTDIAVLKYLQEHRTFFAKENITHSYPHCWRCDWPLLNYAASSWFVNVTQLKPKLSAENKEINWVPESMR